MMASLRVDLVPVGCFTGIITNKGNFGPFDCKQSFGKVMVIDAFGPF